HQRIRDPEVAGRITLLPGDALELLPKLAETHGRPLAIILDPMFPPRRSRSALPPKPMQALRLLLEDRPADPLGPLLEAAFAARPRRVLLKRPPEAPLVGDRPPTFSVGSKLLRWDAWELG
ncbi:MAG: class I SAM-dependent methyltransferase, partial [Planctomycetota bacterium]|nr:class I SAM-dependent methyltransferase [Planctomycetota bacterium]